MVVVALGQAEAAHKVVEDTLSSHGLALNAGKTCVWSQDPGAPPPATLRDQRKPELKLLDADVRFLDRQDDWDDFGAPVQGSMAGTPLVDATNGLVQRLSVLQDAGLRRRMAYTVLRTYAQGCCNHLLQANMEEGRWLDDLEGTLQQGLAQVAGSSLRAGQQALASLRRVDGGLAFGDVRSKSEAAFLGSWGIQLPVSDSMGGHGPG